MPPLFRATRPDGGPDSGGADAKAGVQHYLTQQREISSRDCKYVCFGGGPLFGFLSADSFDLERFGLC